MERTFRLAWCNNGRIWLERLGKAGGPLGEPTDITCEFWGVAARAIEEHGMERIDEHAMVGLNGKTAKCIELKERNKQTGKKRAFRITIQEIAVEEDDEV